MSVVICAYCDKLIDTDVSDVEWIEDAAYHWECYDKLDQDANDAELDDTPLPDSFSIRDLGIRPDTDEEC